MYPETTSLLSQSALWKIHFC